MHRIVPPVLLICAFELPCWGSTPPPYSPDEPKYDSGGIPPRYDQGRPDHYEGISIFRGRQGDFPNAVHTAHTFLTRLSLSHLSVFPTDVFLVGIFTLTVSKPLGRKPDVSLQL
jgi:hypothetical protein